MKVNQIFVKRQAVRFERHLGEGAKVSAVMPHVHQNIAYPLAFAINVEPDLSRRARTRLTTKMNQLNGKRFMQALAKACTGAGYNSRYYGPVTLAVAGLNERPVTFNEIMIENKKLDEMANTEAKKFLAELDLMKKALSCEDGPQLGRPLDQSDVDQAVTAVQNDEHC